MCKRHDNPRTSSLSHNDVEGEAAHDQALCTAVTCRTVCWEQGKLSLDEIESCLNREFEFSAQTGRWRSYHAAASRT